MSVGSSTGAPRRIASTARSTSVVGCPSALHHPLPAGQVERDLDVGVARGPSARPAISAARSSCTSRTSQPSSTRRASAGELLGLALRRRARAAAPSRAPPAPGRRARPRARTAGWRRRGRRGLSSPSSRLVSRKSTSSPSSAAFSRASASASLDTSVAVTVEPGQLVRQRQCDRAASGSHIDDSRVGDVSETCQTPLDHDLGLRTRNERPRVGLQRQPAEAPVAQDVGQRLARGAALEDRPPRGPLGFRERPVALGVQLEPRQSEGLREQELGVDPRASARPSGRDTPRPREAPRRASNRRRLEGAAALLGGQGLRELFEIALEHLLEPVRRRA